MPSVQAYLKDEGFQHIVLVPVQGKKATVGTLALGKASSFAYTPDDLDIPADQREPVRDGGGEPAAA